MDFLDSSHGLGFQLGAWKAVDDWELLPRDSQLWKASLGFSPTWSSGFSVVRGGEPQHDSGFQNVAYITFASVTNQLKSHGQAATQGWNVDSTS